MQGAIAEERKLCPPFHVLIKDERPLCLVRATICHTLSISFNANIAALLKFNFLLGIQSFISFLMRP